MHFRLIAITFLSYVAVLPQDIRPIFGGEGGFQNQLKLSESRELALKSRQRQVVVFTGDRVIPQVVDGATWKTTFYLHNLDAGRRSLTVLFFSDDGADLLLPITGLGVVRGVDLTINSAGTVIFETPGTATLLRQGWAIILPNDILNDTIGGLAVFRQTIPGQPASEAVVPVVSQFDNRFVLLFDNTAFTTAMAVANPYRNAVTVSLRIRDTEARVLQETSFQLRPYEHRAFALPDVWAATRSRQGSIEFTTSSEFGVAVLGLRFSEANFTSFHVLSNFDWLVP